MPTIATRLARAMHGYFQLGRSWRCAWAMAKR